MKVKKILSIILSLSLMLAIFVFPVDASSGTIIEEGYNTDVSDTSNDTWLRSLETYDDYDTYGYLSNSADVDWWDIGFNVTGMANFYLQSPSGCNYTMQIYDYIGGSGTLELIGTITNGASGSFDLAKIHVKQGRYFVKVYSSTGSSASNSYLLRVKNYPDRVSYLSTISVNGTVGSSTPLGNYCQTNISNLGFNTVYDVYNQTASQTFTQVKNSDINIIFGDANAAGIIRMEMISGISTYFAGVSHAALNSNSRAISQYNNGDLSETDLIVFAADKTGATSSVYGNLVDQAMNKGAACAIGWIGNVDQLSMLVWLEYYSSNLADRTPEAALIAADNDAYNYGVQGESYIQITDRYYRCIKSNCLFLNNEIT